MAASKFIEILDNTTNPIAQQHQMSDSDVKLEDVLADQEATVQQHQRSRSSTQSSSSRKSHEYANTSNNNPPRLSMSRDGVVDSQSPSSSASSSPSSSSTSSPTSPVPRMKRLRKFTLTGGFGR